MNIVVLASWAVGAWGAVSAASTASSVTPIEKVVQLLGELLAKGKQEKHSEEVEFAKFHEWCDQTEASTKKSIAEAAAQIQQLTADIAKAEADAETLAGEIAELEAAIAKAKAELSEATAVREKEHAEFEATHKDLSDSVDAIERAIAVLKSREAAVPQSLLQLQQSTSLPREAKAAIESFLMMADSDGATASPEANAYEFQSGGVVAILEKLRLKFQDQKLALEKAELNAKGNFELLAQKLTDNIQEDTKRVGEKTAVKAQRLEDAATAKGDLSVTEKGKAEDEQKLSDTLTACQARSQEFENNQVVRAGEIHAIEQATEILQSDEVAGTAGRHLPALLQVRARGGAAALVQMLRGTESPAESKCRERLAAFLQGQAKKLGSRYLALVATHASEDPFGKVKKLIKDLIVKLMEEANSEADHKAYCDTELATNKQTRENKQTEVDELTASIEKNVAESTQLQEDITLLSDAVATLRREQSEATGIREEEKALNAQTVAEAKAAQVAVEKATQILREFYAKAAENGAALLQGQGRGQAADGLKQEMMQAARAPYKGLQSENGGVIGFLEVILSDFARLEAETNSAEDQAATAYEKFMDESNQDIAVKSTEIEHKTSKKQNLDAATEGLQRELHLTQEELDAALAYYDKLKPDCVDLGLSYEERVRLREEEIQSLQEALQILSAEDLA